MIRNHRPRVRQLMTWGECNSFASQVFPGEEPRRTAVDEFAAVTGGDSLRFREFGCGRGADGRYLKRGFVWGGSH